MQEPHVVNLEHLIEGTAEQLEFFERAVVLLAQASDAELIEHAKGYLAGRTDSVGAQLMQHTHRLHPIRYLEYLESNAAEDLEEFRDGVPSFMLSKGHFEYAWGGFVQNHPFCNLCGPTIYDVGANQKSRLEQQSRPAKNAP